MRHCGWSERQIFLHPSERYIWLQLLEPSQHYTRLFYSTGLGQARRQLPKCTKVFGSLLQGIVGVFGGLIVTPCLIMGVTETDHKNDILRIIRAEAQSLSEMLQRSLRLTIKGKCVPEKSMRCREIRIEFECALKFVLRRIDLSAHGGELTECKMGPWVAAVQFSGSDCMISVTLPSLVMWNTLPDFQSVQV